MRVRKFEIQSYALIFQMQLIINFTPCQDLECLHKKVPLFGNQVQKFQPDAPGLSTEMHYLSPKYRLSFAMPAK